MGKFFCFFHAYITCWWYTVKIHNLEPVCRECPKWGRSSGCTSIFLRVHGCSTMIMCTRGALGSTLGVRVSSCSAPGYRIVWRIVPQCYISVTPVKLTTRWIAVCTESPVYTKLRSSVLSINYIFIAYIMYWHGLLKHPDAQYWIKGKIIEVIRTSLQYSTKIISLNIFDKFHEKASKTEIVS